MIERNYRTWCAQNDIPLEDGPAADVGMDDVDNDIEMDADDGMDVDDGDDDDDELPDFFKSESKKEVKKKSRGKVGDLVREKIKKVLDDTGLAQQRAGKCDEADFLK